MATIAHPLPYATTPVFDQDSLPRALRRDHSLKEGAWGIIRVLEGRLLHVIHEPRSEQVLTPERPGLVNPGQLHAVEPLGELRMRVEFYDAPPLPFG